jgi:hypothetical protein
MHSADTTVGRDSWDDFHAGNFMPFKAGSLRSEGIDRIHSFENDLGSRSYAPTFGPALFKDSLSRI